MSAEESPPFEVGDKLQIEDELREGDLVRFEKTEPGRISVRPLELGDLDESSQALFRVFTGPEGPEFQPVIESFDEILAWEKLRHVAIAAEDRGSNWARFAFPLEALVVYAPGEDLPAKRTFEEADLTPEARASLESYLLLCSKIPPPNEPLRVLAGLRIQIGQIPRGSRSAVLETVFAPDSVVEMRGVLSASAAPEPPLFAAGVQGAILDILIHDAAFMSRVTGFRREAEFALPMDCRCRVTAFEPEVPYEAIAGHTFFRPTIRLEQIDQTPRRS